MNINHEKIGYAAERITFTAPQSVDITSNPITFEINNHAKISSIYAVSLDGGSGKHQWLQEGNTIKLAVTKWWPEGASYVVPEGAKVTFTLETSAPVDSLEITNFRFGDQGASPSYPSADVANETTPPAEGDTSYVDLQATTSVKEPRGWPEKAIVGYVKGYASSLTYQPNTTTDMIKQAIKHGYNVFVYAFAGQKNNNEPYFAFSDDVIRNLAEQLKEIHNANCVALISVGGARNTYNPDFSNIQAIVDAGKKMADFMARYDFDGLDLDVEHPPAGVEDHKLLSMLKSLRESFYKKKGRQPYVTIAPQLIAWYSSDNRATGYAQFAERIYTQKLFDEGKLTAVLIQTYNQGGGVNYAGISGTDVGIITETFNSLSEMNHSMNPSSLLIPRETKIIVGVPNFKASYISKESYPTSRCTTDGSCTGIGLYDPQDIIKDIKDGGILNQSQYGGLMTWIMNADSYQSWTWVDKVAPLHGTLPSDSVTSSSARGEMVDFNDKPATSSYNFQRTIGGYWENWNPAIMPGKGMISDPAYYKNDLANLTHVYYSFLTLAKNPSPDSPPQEYWDGEGLYESMTAEDVMTVMTKTDPLWNNPGEWQRKKIDALLRQTQNQGGKFIWAIGGWSDLTKTLKSTQIGNFTNRCVKLLQSVGDGIDFDWEHLSASGGIVEEQRNNFADVLLSLRNGLDGAGLGDKEIIYTTRFNAFWDSSNRPAGYKAFNSDTEGLSIEKRLKEFGSSLRNVVNKVQIMMYDVPPSDLNAPGGFTLLNYRNVLNAFEQYFDKHQIVMGFEPGYQAAGGKWEGMAVDQQVIDYIYDNGYGGIMFWAMNQPVIAPSLEVTGENARLLAEYAKQKFV